MPGCWSWPRRTGLIWSVSVLLLGCREGSPDARGMDLVNALALAVLPSWFPGRSLLLWLRSSRKQP